MFSFSIPWVITYIARVTEKNGREVLRREGTEGSMKMTFSLLTLSEEVEAFAPRQLGSCADLVSYAVPVVDVLSNIMPV